MHKSRCEGKFYEEKRFMKKKEIFRGAATALVTPFSNGEIDYDSLFRLIDYQISAGIDAIVIGGTTGEAATLSDEERYRLFEVSAERVGGRTKLIFGTGTNDTRVAIAHTKYAERIGCDGVLLVTPYYNKGTEPGIEKHYLSIAESTDLPIIVYNVPSRTGVNLGIDLLMRLSNQENIVGIKESSDSVDRLVSLACLKDRLKLYSGNDSQIFPTLALGGSGVISVLSNLMPREISQLCRLVLSGELDEARKIQFKLMPLIRAMFIETNPTPIKYAMSLRGMCNQEMRLPLSEPKESTKSEIRGIISSEE